MPKNIIQDMVKAKRERTPLKKVPELRIESKKEIKREPVEEYYEVPESDSENSSRYGLWVIAAGSVAFLIFALSMMFSGARINITPKVKALTLDQNFSAVKDAKDGLSFDLVSISGEETKSIQGGEESDVTEPAKGTVIIYNAFSSAPQNLLIDTRLEGSNGKIYKTDQRVIVPGMNKDGTPGSIEVGIYGSEPGESYNSAPLDFKIFGFKGTPKYEKFYARSKGEIKGGFVGKARKVSELDKTSAVSELKDALQVKLLKKVSEEIPSGYVLFKDATFVQTDDGVEGVASDDGKVPVTVKGIFYGFLFKEDQLTKKIVEENIDKYDGSEVFIPNLKDLTFTLSNKESISFKDATNINFSLVGSAKIVWRIDTEKITAEVLGRKKNVFSQVLSQYPNIESADLVVKPAWKSSFPSKIKDIKIIVNYPQ